MNILIKNNIKDNGQIYTPSFIVRNILDFSNYYGNDILEKHIIDNSCGNGAFLTEIVERYCRIFLEKNKKDDLIKLKKNLEKYIHGIEIQEKEIQDCLLNLNEVANRFGIKNVNWDLICSDTLFVNKYDGQMDFVIGNPPYVRVHNLKDNYKKVKEFSFSQNGMTDLYIVFFEIGLKMLNKNGKMGLITPSSFLQSNAGAELRNYILKNKNLSKIIDLEHFQPFKATTYTIISLFEMSKQDNHIEYFVFDKDKLEPKKIDDLTYSDIFIENKIYFSNKKNLDFLRKIETYKSKDNYIEVKNGFATLSDSLFINNFDFEENVINVLKASTGKWHKCIFPYKEDGKPFSIKELKNNSKLYRFLLENKSKLEKRSLERKGQWFLFGRSQGIKDVYKEKVAINTLLKDLNSIKLEKVPSGSGVYSGLYILTDLPLLKVEQAIKDIDFLKYVKLLKKYKSGGYYTFSSGELKKFLNYKLIN